VSKVVIQDCKDYSLTSVISKINTGIEKIGGWGLFVKPQDKVLLKVNLIGPKPPESAAITHSQFVRALVRILKEQGCTVWVGEPAEVRYLNSFHIKNFFVKT
jgi:uncharacterized protein (DUF362 family)